MRRCRARFPKDLLSESELVIQNKMLTYEPQRNHITVNKYHPFITLSWRANTDITPILNGNGPVRYASKYVGKPETASE